MTLKKQVGTNIRAARRRAGLTIEELADRIGKTDTTIGQIERGGSAPGFTTLEDLSRALKTPLGFLFPMSLGKRITARERLVSEVTGHALALDKEDLETLNLIAAALAARRSDRRK